jgi:hypothetical protein
MFRGFALVGIVLLTISTALLVVGAGQKKHEASSQRSDADVETFGGETTEGWLITGFHS